MKRCTRVVRELEIEQNEINEGKRVRLDTCHGDGDVRYVTLDADVSTFSRNAGKMQLTGDFPTTQKTSTPINGNNFTSILSFPSPLSVENSVESDLASANAENAEQTDFPNGDIDSDIETNDLNLRNLKTAYVAITPLSNFNIFPENGAPILSSDIQSEVPDPVTVNSTEVVAEDNLRPEVRDARNIQNEHAMQNAYVAITRLSTFNALSENAVPMQNGLMADEPIISDDVVPEVQDAVNMNSADVVSDDNLQPEVKDNDDVDSAINVDNSRCDTEYFLSSLLQVTMLEGHADSVLSVAADKNIILSASRDTTVKLWDSVLKKEMCSFRGHTDAVTSVLLLTSEQTALLSANLSYTGISKIAISGSSDCSIRLWSIPAGEELLSIYTYNSISCLGYFEPQSYIVIGTDGGKLELWDVTTSKLVHSVFAHEDSITDLKVDKCYVYTTSVDGMVKVWLIEENELQVLYTRRRKEIGKNPEHFIPCQWKSVVSHDGILYLGDNTSNVKILDWNEGRLNMVRNQLQEKGVTEALFTKKNILLTTSYDAGTDVGAINVWQLPSMTYICTMSGDVSQIFSLAITEADKGILQVVSGGSKLLVWEYNCSQPPLDGGEDAFYCCELDELGEEISTDKFSKTFSPKKQGSDLPVITKPSSSWCNLI